MLATSAVANIVNFPDELTQDEWDFIKRALYDKLY